MVLPAGLHDESDTRPPARHSALAAARRIALQSTSRTRAGRQCEIIRNLSPFRASFRSARVSRCRFSESREGDHSRGDVG